MLYERIPGLFDLAAIATVGESRSRHSRGAKVHRTVAEDILVADIDARKAEQEDANAHYMAALKQLACAVIHRAIDDAEALGASIQEHDKLDAKAFLLSVERLYPWATLAGVRPDAVVDFAVKRGYDRSQSVPLAPIDLNTIITIEEQEQ